MYLLDKQLVFPPVFMASSEGVLAIGGDLSVPRLKLAYRSGIFPWYNEGEPIIWYSPDPRMVLFPGRIRVSKSMQKIMDSGIFSFTENQCFEDVIQQCKTIPREGQQGTWITKDMQKAYIEFHKAGFAKSVEVWQDNELVGGLYGIDLGHVFCGESMFSSISNASKAGFIYLTRKLESRGYCLIDCQIYNQHLESLGAEEISREAFLGFLKESSQASPG
jgi:leucyl/phenylalanyl-tRNA--protein transferase